MFRFAIFVAATSITHPAMAQTAQCHDVVTVAEAYSQHVRIFTDMANWCMDDRMQQEACQRLGNLAVDGMSAEKDSMASASLAMLARQCPD